MSPSRLEVSEHAKDRLKQRAITRQQVRATIERGSISGVDLRGRIISTKTFGTNVLVVIYLAVAGGYILITAYWR